MKRVASTLMVMAIVAVSAQVYSHCEIPCGIYGDRMRIALIDEDIDTIEKSMREIRRLSGSRDENQLVRWIVNKDDHANKIQHTVYQYFMAQRITPVAKGSAGYDKYLREIKDLHEMIVYAMKCKQTTDLGNTKKLRALLRDFEKSYFEEEHQK
jgi:nickel superoxide dismutase